MLRKFRRLNELSPGELFILLQFIGIALTVRSALAVLRLQDLIQILAWGANNRFLRCLPLLHTRYEQVLLTHLASIAARNIRPDGPCLLRSLLLFWLLKTRRKPVQLVIGISKDATGLESHAWVETRGRVVGDSVDMIERFATLLRF